MIITIFFMLASLSLIVFLPIYIKKKNDFYKLGSKEKMSLKKQKKKMTTIFGIDEIQNGIISANGTRSIIVELGSIEYRLLNDEEQNNIDILLTKLSKTFSFQTQFFSTIERIDTTDKVEKIRENIENQKNSKIKEYGESIIEYLEDIMQEDNLYVRKNYFIASSNEPFLKADAELVEFFQNLKYSLAGIKVSARLLSDMEIIELIHRELNKNTNDKIRNIIEEGGLDFYVEAKSKA